MSMGDEHHPECDEAASLLLERASKDDVDRTIDWSEVEADEDHCFTEWRDE